MTPEEVKQYYGSAYRFNQQTGMSHATLLDWLTKGYVPFPSQCLLEKVTNGKLKTNWKEEK